MLHTLFSDVPVEQQETVAGGDGISCSCFNKVSQEDPKKFDKFVQEIRGINWPFPFPFFLLP
ncbi:hypothetical protein IQ226_19115 [Dolichospermum sp. LEGE 00240]|uniref:hypothetical protein n=1 Tax=Dolichospermum sp. LEGE 00240 TaxID=1828603 RepID=UPI001880EF42|nr:hypothetical protein [Dolichospermum sp. LEGE 00240]MBE9251202.1 hypothetical protein [Dolichospermum sp. LEGE 00240]